MDVESSSSDVLSRFWFICNRNLFVCPCTTTLCLRLLICPVNVVPLINHLRELLIYFLPFIEARIIKQFKSHFRTLLLLLRQYHVCYPDAPVDFLSAATRIHWLEWPCHTMIEPDISIFRGGFWRLIPLKLIRSPIHCKSSEGGSCVPLTLSLLQSIPPIPSHSCVFYPNQHPCLQITLPNHPNDGEIDLSRTHTC
jgi:hypothetical protein